MNPSESAAAALFRGIVQPLLSWYSIAAREMPWRMQQPDPYRTLISEIMLQQTRVETVKPYYERFIAALPNLKALAEAEEEPLLKLWEGLGYYSRVRNLQKAARAVMSDFEGKIPAERKLLLQLPGIGEYTAGAIASIAFGLPEPAVDGNVLRVCTRLLDCHRNIAEPDLRKTIREQLKKVYPKGKCSEFTQSLMDLGAMICVPGNPHCPECPLKKMCRGQSAGTAPDLPVKDIPQPRRMEYRTVFLLESEKGRIALRKRPDKGILAGLWEYPSAAGTFTLPQVKNWLDKHKLSVRMIRKADSGRHVFTHLEWHMTSWRILCRAENPDFTWADRAELESVYSLPGAFKHFMIGI